jgi:hypothetical protein
MGFSDRTGKGSGGGLPGISAASAPAAETDSTAPPMTDIRNRPMTRPFTTPHLNNAAFKLSGV